MTPEAIRALREQVEAGEALATGDIYAMRRDLPDNIVSWRKTIYDAFHGSLDAAKALHESVLHERTFVKIHWSKRYEDESRVSINLGRDGWHSASSTPARAWLIAILRALEEEANANG